MSAPAQPKREVRANSFRTGGAEIHLCYLSSCLTGGEKITSERINACLTCRVFSGHRLVEAGSVASSGTRSSRHTSLPSRRTPGIRSCAGIATTCRSRPDVSAYVHCTRLVPCGGLRRCELRERIHTKDAECGDDNRCESCSQCDSNVKARGRVTTRRQPPSESIPHPLKNGHGENGPRHLG